MQSVITSKYQTTIPKAIREYLGLAVKDALEWKVEKGKITVYPVILSKKFNGFGREKYLNPFQFSGSDVIRPANHINLNGSFSNR